MLQFYFICSSHIFPRNKQLKKLSDSLVLLSLDHSGEQQVKLHHTKRYANENDSKISCVSNGIYSLSCLSQPGGERREQHSFDPWAQLGQPVSTPDSD
jgi:hypothetical protein